jgi:hypothetical protein
MMKICRNWRWSKFKQKKPCFGAIKQESKIPRLPQSKPFISSCAISRWV